MPSNLDYDPELLNEAQKIGGHRYKKDAVNAALKEYVQRRKQPSIIQLFGKIDYDEAYDYKQARNRKCAS